jgi:hypothetical protein
MRHSEQRSRSRCDSSSTAGSESTGSGPSFFVGCSGDAPSTRWQPRRQQYVNSSRTRTRVPLVSCGCTWRAPRCGDADRWPPPSPPPSLCHRRARVRRLLLFRFVCYKREIFTSVVSRFPGSCRFYICSINKQDRCRSNSEFDIDIESVRNLRHDAFVPLRIVRHQPNRTAVRVEHTHTHTHTHTTTTTTTTTNLEWIHTSVKQPA